MSVADIREICGRALGNTGRVCTRLPGHADGLCAGDPPAAPISKPIRVYQPHTVELATLAFMFGMMFSNYDPRYFRSEDHVKEVVTLHVKRLGLSLNAEQEEMIRKIAFKYFN